MRDISRTEPGVSRNEPQDEKNNGEHHKAGRLYSFYVVGLLSATMAFSLIDRFALSLLFEPIKADLGLSDTQLGLLHGLAFGLFYAAIGIPMGRLVDLWSRKWVIFWGVAVWSVATVACGLARSFSQLLLARIGVGVGEATLSPAGYSIITDTVQKQWLATAISVFQMGSLIGGGLAFLLGGAIYTAISAAIPLNIPFLDQFQPWQLTFFVLGLPGIVFMILTVLLREPPRRGRDDKTIENNVDESAAAKTAANIKGVFPYLWENKGLFGSLMLGNACIIAISYGMLSWSSAVLARELGWSLSDIGFRVGIIMLTAAPAGVLLGGVLADKWSRLYPKNGLSRVLVMAGVLTLPFLIALQFVQTGLQFFVLMTVIQFTTGLVVGIGPAAIQIVSVVKLRGRASAVYVFAVNAVGLGLGPVSIGLLSDYVFSGDKNLLHALATYSTIMCCLAIFLLLKFMKYYAREADEIARRMEIG